MSKKTHIYLDYHASTPVDPEVLESMLPYFSEHYGNAHSKHYFGLNAAAAVKHARQVIADVIGTPNCEDIIFTSGASEANNLALLGVSKSLAPNKAHFICSNIEHASVLEVFNHLEKWGHEVTFLPVNSEGVLEPQVLAAAIKPNTCLFSIIAAHNEIGTIQNLAALSQITEQHNILLHVDAAQALGKIPLNVDLLGIDLLSFASHKFYGPKGVGALYLRSRPKATLIKPLVLGGGHEKGLRAGSLNVAGIVGMAKALQKCVQLMPSEQVRIAGLRDRLWQNLSAALDEIKLNGHPSKRLAGNLNISFAGIDAQVLMLQCSQLAFSTGSACSSGHISPVAKAIGLNDSEARGMLRFGLGRFTTEDEIELASELIISKIKKL